MASQKFPASHRLLNSSEFNAVFDANEMRLSKPGLLFLAKQNQRGFNRLGMVVGKKNTPRAVDRNTIKRRIRESFRRVLSEECSVDVVVLTRANALSHDLGPLLDQGFEQINQQSSRGMAR